MNRRQITGYRQPARRIKARNTGAAVFCNIFSDIMIPENQLITGIMPRIQNFLRKHFQIRPGCAGHIAVTLFHLCIQISKQLRHRQLIIPYHRILQIVCSLRPCHECKNIGNIRCLYHACPNGRLNRIIIIIRDTLNSQQNVEHRMGRHFTIRVQEHAHIDPVFLIAPHHRIFNQFIRKICPA